MKVIIFFGLILFTILPVSALRIGDEAPELEVAKWVKNGPVKIVEGKGKTLYVIEFWATWCPPCEQSIPFLSYIQKKFKDKNVVVVGISKEPEKKVSEFVKAQKNMDYNVGVDQKGKTTRAYMKDDQTIPMAFLVNKKSKLMWKGHPMDLESVLEKTIIGTFDIDEYKKVADLRGKMQKALQLGKNAEVADFAGKILAMEPRDQLAIRMLAFALEQNKNPREAVDYISRIIDKLPQNEQLHFIKLNLIVRTQNIDDIHKCAQGIFHQFKSKPMVLNYLSIALMENTVFGTAPLDVIVNSAKTAVREIKSDKDKMKYSSCLMTLARAHYVTGNLPKAIKTQKQAFENAKGTKLEENSERILEFYRSAIKARQP